MALNPSGLKQLEEGIEQRGFSLNLRALDEEMAAQVIEVLTIHLFGVPLDNIGGSRSPKNVIDILKAAKRERCQTSRCSPRLTAIGSMSILRSLNVAHKSLLLSCRPSTNAFGSS